MLNQTNNINIHPITQKEHFKLWLATPSTERIPSTQQELAIQLGVHPVTLSKWKDKQFMDSVVELVHNHMRQYTVDVVHSIVLHAKAGSYQHARLFLEYIESWSKEQIHTEPITLEDLIDDAKREEISRQQQVTNKENPHSQNIKNKSSSDGEN